MKNVFKNTSPLFSACTLLRAEVLLFCLTVNLRRRCPPAVFQKCDVRCGEHVSCFGKVHSASSPPSLHFFIFKKNKTNYVFFFGFCAMTCRFLHLWPEPHVLRICYRFLVIRGQEFKAFFVFEVVRAVYFTLPSPSTCDCVRCECEFYFFQCLFLLFKSPILSLSVFCFFNL